MVVNLVKIKQLVNRIIKKLEENIEVSGMEGDTGYVEYLQTELDTVNKVKSELEGYQNTTLSLPFLKNSLRVASPSLDLNYLIRELDSLVQVKEQQLLEFEKSIESDKILLEKLKNSISNPQELPNISK